MAPVVSARNRGSEEIIISDEHGLLVEPADPEDLAEKILVALDREWIRRRSSRMQSSIRGKISRRRSWECINRF